MGLNESPSKKEGKCAETGDVKTLLGGLNESPSKKEGKYNGVYNRLPERMPQ